MTTFNESGVSFKASTAVTTVKRANILFNANGAPMTYREIEQALYANELNPSSIYRVVLGYTVGGVVKGVKLTTNRLQLAGQRSADGKLVGATAQAHSFVKNQAKLMQAPNIRGTITIGAKDQSYYFGYAQADSTYTPCIASVSASYDKDTETYAEITALIAANPDMELGVYYIPTPDFTAWCKCMAAMTAQSA